MKKKLFAALTVLIILLSNCVVFADEDTSSSANLNLLINTFKYYNVVRCYNEDRVADGYNNCNYYLYDLAMPNSSSISSSGSSKMYILNSSSSKSQSFSYYDYSKSKQLKDIFTTAQAQGYIYYILGTVSEVSADGTTIVNLPEIWLFKEIPKVNKIYNTYSNSVYIINQTYWQFYYDDNTNNNDLDVIYISIAENDSSDFDNASFYISSDNQYTLTAPLLTNIDYNVDSDDGSYLAGDVYSFQSLGIKSNFDIVFSTNDVISATDDNTTELEVLETNKSILQILKDLPDTLSNFFQSLLDGIIDALKTLFIPSDDFFNDWFTDLQDAVEKQLGFLSYPFTWILEILNKFLTLTDTASYLITWNDVFVPNFENHVIISGGSFDLASLLENSTIKSFHDMYLTIIDALLMLAFMNYCFNVYSRIFGGSVDNYEYLTEEDTTIVNNLDGNVLKSTHTTSNRTIQRNRKV